MEDPKNEIETLENEPLTSDGGKFVQITPQRVRLKLRVGRPARVPFQVKMASQYPVDLYYLMDLSNSMSEDKDNVVGKKIISKANLHM